MQDGERSDKPVLQLRWRIDGKAKLSGIKSFINRLEEVEILICELFFMLCKTWLSRILHEIVKVFWVLFVTCEKAEYFYMAEFYKGV